MAEQSGDQQAKLDHLELLALRTVAGAIGEGLSLEATVQHCLDETLRHLGLDFGCVYIRRHDYLLRMASRGLNLPAGPQALLPLTEAPWAQRPFTAQQGASHGLSQVPEDVSGKTWMSVPLRIHGHLAGVLIVGGYSLPTTALPPMETARRVAMPIAVAIDNAERLTMTRGILNDTRDVIFRTDLRGRWTYLNQAWQETFGEPVGQALGHRADSYVAAEHRARLGAGIEALVPRGSVIGRQTLPFVGRGGQILWMDVQTRLVRNDRGEVIGAAGVMRDVSVVVRQARELTKANEQLRRYTEQLEHANRELAEADRLKSEFLATASHELRTPLGLILGYAEMLLDGAPDPVTPGQTEYLELILEGGHRLERLVLQMLEMAKLEGGMLELQTEPTSLGEAVRDVCRRYRPTANAVEVELDEPWPADDAWLVAAAPDRLRQVLEILYDNAIKFSEPGGRIRTRVELREAAEPDLLANGTRPEAPRFAQVTIEDDGVGIPAARLSLAFRMFAQVDGSDTRQHGGLGLGLVIGKALVEGMGGGITIASDGPHHGTRVAFTLPLAEAPAA